VEREGMEGREWKGGNGREGMERGGDGEGREGMEREGDGKGRGWRRLATKQVLTLHLYFPLTLPPLHLHLCFASISIFTFRLFYSISIPSPFHPYLDLHLSLSPYLLSPISTSASASICIFTWISASIAILPVFYPCFCFGCYHDFYASPSLLVFISPLPSTSIYFYPISAFISTVITISTPLSISIYIYTPPLSPPFYLAATSASTLLPTLPLHHLYLHLHLYPPASKTWAFSPPPPLVFVKVFGLPGQMLGWTYYHGRVTWRYHHGDMTMKA
jgi:hypothetical protein